MSLTPEEQIEQLRVMLRNTQKELEASEKKRKQAEQQQQKAAKALQQKDDELQQKDDELKQKDNELKIKDDALKSVQSVVSCLLTVLAKSIPNATRQIKKLLPLNSIDLPQEQIRLLKACLATIEESAQNMPALFGIAKYNANKQTESSRRVNIGKAKKDVDKAKADLDKTTEERCRSIETNERFLSDAFKVTNAAAKLPEQGPSKDTVIEATTFIADKAVGLPDTVSQLQELATQNVGKKTMGRQTVQAKQDAPIIDPSPLNYQCPNCKSTSHWIEMAQLRAFLRTLSQSTAELYKSVQANYGVYQCGNCNFIHLHVPTEVGLSTSPQGTISQDVAIEFGVAMAHGIPGNRFENMLNLEDEQLGSDTLGRNAHRWMNEGPGAAMLKALKAELHSQPGCSCDESPFDILQQSGKSRKKIESSAKQAYICVQNSLPSADKKVELYCRLESRSADSIIKSFDQWKPELLVTDGYQAYRGWAEEIGCRHQVCLVHWRREVLQAIKSLSLMQEGAANLSDVAEQIRNHDPYRLLTSVGSALSRIYHEETVVYRRLENESTESHLKRIHAGRQAIARPLMDRVDVLINLLAPKYAKRKGNKYEKAGSNEIVSNAVVYYLNARDQLRSFLDEPRLSPDTNISERMVRAMTTLRSACCFKQSQEFTDSMCGWFTLVQTAKSNGINEPIAWLVDYGKAYLQHCWDQTLTMEYARGRPTRKLMRFAPEAVESFDPTPWLPWNWAKRQKQPKKKN